MNLPMTPLDRYLKTLKTFLPREQQDDIVRELSENLRSQMDDREAELGRPLTEAEQKAILERHGDPLTVAGGYRQDQRSVAFGRQLIGPVLFPLYLRVLRLNLGITFLVCLAIFTALRGPANFLSAVPAIFLQLLLQFGIVTAIFAAAESHLARVPEKEKAQKAAPPAGSRVPRLESFAELVALVVFLGWILAAGPAVEWVSGPEADAVALGPVWRAIFWPTVLVTLAGAVRAAVNLYRPDWTGLRAVGRVVLGGAWLALFAYLAMAGDWVVPVQGPAATAETLGKVELVNRWFFFYPLLVTVAFAALHLVLEVRKLLQHRRRRLIPLACVTLLAVVGTSVRGDGAAPPAEGTFASNGVRIHYLTAGRGEAVVLLHGFAASAEMWQPRVFPALAERFRVLALDCRGHGASEKPHEPGRYGMEMVEDVVRLLDHLGIERAHVVARSWRTRSVA